ncbi:Beta-barrel assembly machine subunit BamE [Parasphingorhabdus marina DSM 22363]|uniref:Beta-barrel assembly machine subunit BamE n=1 Tax=Parasphingorhabdus marina DSM 22363 TaxID=1123272 RepID=A0A1N6DEY1_9SPHN|nr:outer membrane protein assembly factor BamE [Parasphingorhabdus marina]SIN69233.1 Beta-barrel assembly machine subunit BamE [Parasphingorhabdus marina DSM 22363]
MNSQTAGTLKARLTLVGLVAGSLALAGCSQVRGHQGYIVDPVLTSAIQPGVDNRQSVEATLGRPTFAGQFEDRVWYYVSRDTRQYAFNSPRPKDQLVMRVQFDEAGNVTSVDRTGLELAVNITPDGDTTPTLGRERSFFQELFGNIGAVGAPGATGQSNDRTRP